jgi:FtsZ-interacting cell division protein ZipA
VPTADDPSRAPRSGLILMLIIVGAVALIALYANVQKARRDKIETVTIIPVSSSPIASPSPHD